MRRGRLVVGVLAATGLALSGCSGGAPSSIELGRVGRATVTEVVEAPANVVARASASIAAPASGTVAVLAVADGATVSRGQVLLRISSPDADRALAQARSADTRAASAAGISTPRVDLAALRGPETAARRAFADARKVAATLPDGPARTKALAEVAAVEADYAAATASVRRTVAQLDAGLGSVGKLASSLAEAQRVQTRAAVAAARTGVDALTVRAPIAGTVVFTGPSSAGGARAGSDASAASAALQQLPANVQAQAQALLPAAAAGAGGGSGVSGLLAAGAVVSSGNPLLTITDLSALSLTAAVDETDVLLVRPGVAADVELDAVPGATYPATVRSVDLQPTTSSRGGVSYGIRLGLGAGRTEKGDAAPSPRPGMSAVARLRVRTATDAVSVPASTVFRDGARDAVWTVRSGRAHRQPVDLGAQGEERVEITGGLALGDQVVIRGADRVTEGQQVGTGSG